MVETTTKTGSTVKTEKAVRLNSEKTIANDYFKVKIGTTNKINPQVVYVEGKTFIKPLNEKDDYNKDIVELKRAFNKTLQKYLTGDKLYVPKYIFDFQVAQSGISTAKKSFLTFQFLMRQKVDKQIMKLKDIKTASEDLINNIINEFSEHVKSHDFSITKTKR